MNQLLSSAAFVPMVLPPGMEKLSIITAWITGLISLGLFIAFLVSIGKTGFEALRRGEFTGGMSSIIILICAMALGAATAIFTTFSVVG